MITPKRTNLSKVAIQRNAERRFAVDVPFRASREPSEERPSYSKDVLNELRQSTPSTPANISISTSEWEDEDGTEASTALDVAAKFGSSLARYNAPTAIPTDAEIREKKERRARLAKEQDFISLDAASDGDEDMDDNVTTDDQGRLILKPNDKYPETRLVRDDEDIFEDFDDFTTDGKIALSRNAEKDARSQKRHEMATLIANAEGQSDDEDSDSSEAERNAAFDQAQTRSGTYGSRTAEDPERPHTPPKIAPLPTLDKVLASLQARLEEMEIAQKRKEQEVESLRAERRQIEGEEIRVQGALKETAEKFDALRKSVLGKANTESATEGSELEIVPKNGPESLPNAFDPNAMRMQGRGGLGLGAGATTKDESDEDSEY